MGNQLVGVAPSQIFPVEHYLSDHGDLAFDQSLGSTRFLKVARARSREGLIVVKVFAVHDPSLPLAEHKERILKIKEQLASACNCLPFQKVILTDKAGLLMREYCKYSVYDRLSTRPFLTELEKKWITFQVLYALHRMHKLGVCHGDIKLENIMVTSWLWVLLTDVASFKPTFLPEDNPADFTYFFDTSRRRLCYVAPERFVKAPEPGARQFDDRTSGLLMSESPCSAGELAPSMDIFSAGCALIELWNDGTPALDLTGLLAYRAGGPRPPSMGVSGNAGGAGVSGGAPPRGLPGPLAALLESMTERDPRDRKSAEVYLDEARGKLFPEYFYSFLQSYMLIFSAPPILPPDEKILRIHQDIGSIVKIFTQPSQEKNYSDLAEEVVARPAQDIDALMRDGFKVLDTRVPSESSEPAPAAPPAPPADGLLLLTALVTSCVRGSRHATSKLRCLEILQTLCEYSSSETILDRILPYIIHLSHEPSARVRCAALGTLSRALASVGRVPPRDADVFPEYVLPEVAPRAADPAAAVRAAYARHIASLAETAVRFLDQTQRAGGAGGGGAGGGAGEGAAVNYETELAALHEMVRATVSALLTDPAAAVKRALLEHGIAKLCVFFGKQKANDVILSHMVTFLNDKEEEALRACFFERVVGVCAYVGQQSAPILVPLIQQGLTDPSEWIIAAAVRAGARLAELGLLHKQPLCDLLAETVPYLAHPNLWIRHEVGGLVACVSSLLNPIDVNCKILPLVWPHLKYKLIQTDRAELVLQSLAPPVPRAVYDGAARSRDVLYTLRERRAARLKMKQGTVPQYSEMGQPLKNLFRRLVSDGMTETVENQLLAMSAHLIKIQRSATQHITDAPGRLVLRQAGLSRAAAVDRADAAPPDKRAHSAPAHDSHVNADWQHMFGHAPPRDPPAAPASPPPGAPPPLPAQMGHSASYVQYSVAPCREELRNVIARTQQKYRKSLRSLEADALDSDAPATWRPGNNLMAFLHEHKSKVNHLVTLPAHRNLFASCSDDGTVRLWDVASMEGNAYINRSKAVYNRGGGGVVSLGACEAGASLVAATHEGSIFVLRSDGPRLQLSQGRQGAPGDGACVAGAGGGVIVYSTPDACLVGWDLRMPGDAFRLAGDIRLGAATCLHADRECYVAAAAGGCVRVWDLRFRLPVTAVTPGAAGERIRRLSGWGGRRVWACGARDAALCLETTQRVVALAPHREHASYTSAVYCAAGGECVVTGGADMRVRRWDLARPADSRLLLLAPADPLRHAPHAVKYRSRVIDGTTVIQELIRAPTPPPLDEPPPPRAARAHHHAAPLTALAAAAAARWYLLSASADGVVCVWK